MTALITLRNEIKETTRYETHDNGGRPFRVDVGPDVIKVYYAPGDADDDEDDETERHTKLCYTVRDFEGVFVGVSKDDLSYKINDYFEGNCILIHITGNKYVFVGSEIYEFTTIEPIIKFIAEVGNNDVPYPYAETNTCIYYLTDYYVYTIKQYTSAFKKQSTDPYRYMYDNVKNKDKDSIHVFHAFEPIPMVRFIRQHTEVKIYGMLISDALLIESENEADPEEPEDTDFYSTGNFAIEHIHSSEQKHCDICNVTHQHKITLTSLTGDSPLVFEHNWRYNEEVKDIRTENKTDIMVKDKNVQRRIICPSTVNRDLCYILLCDHLIS